ncbi:MAG: hypothetical protein ACX931_12985 [Saccharospirillum sp.]
MRIDRFFYLLPTWLKKQAGFVMPACIVLGLLVPSLAEQLNHWLYPAFVVPLTISIARLAWVGQWQMLKRWPLMTLVSAWLLVGSPVLIWLVFKGVPVSEPLFMALVLAAAAPPLTACGALAFFLRIDANLAVVVTLLTMALTPLTLPPLALYLLGLELNIALLPFMGRLAMVVGVSFVGAWLMKRWLGQPCIDRHGDFLDGIGLGCIGAFIVGLMTGLPALMQTQPIWVLLCLVTTGVLVFGLNGLGVLLFSRLARQTALSIGLVSGQLNLGLMYLVLQDDVSVAVLSVFAIGQIPLYLLPGVEQWYLRFYGPRAPTQ